jgi:hypothetical protein
LVRKDFNILEKFNSSEFRLIRKRIIECILATDMTNHAKNITSLKNKLSLAEVSEGNNFEKLFENIEDSAKFENQQIVLNNILHVADISNPAKLTSTYKNWIDLVFQEFFFQGDLEKKENLQVSLLCDRVTTDVTKSQIGFIKFVVKPTFEIIRQISPEIKTYLDYINKNLRLLEEGNLINK